VSLYFQLVFNFFYTQYLQELMVDTIGAIIKLGDYLQVNTHILRYLYLSIFDDRLGKTSLPHLITLDLFLVMCCATPLFVIGLLFWTAPVYSTYARKINSIVAPLGLSVAFVGHHWDVIMLGLLTFLMNVYVYWYHIDPPYTPLQGGKYQRYRRSGSSDSDEDVDRIKKYERKIDYSEAAKVGIDGLAMGMPLANMFSTR